jgi:anti-sigma regulatory factor (Ser/Thr protein kinase)
MEIAGAGTSLEGDFIGVEQPTDAAEARRLAMARASRLAFEEADAGKLGLVVTEIARNLVKHASRGDIYLRTLEHRGDTGVEVLALDKGPGIEDVGRSFQDGYSTAGTAGTGLGAVARLSHVYDIYSRRGQGTVIMAQVWKQGAPARGHRYRAGGLVRALQGEDCCGDGWLVQQRAVGARLLVADGLGHGEHAAAAARASVLTALERPGDAPPALLEKLHGTLRSTRGAAVAVAEVDPKARVVRFAGVGNISAMVIPPSGPWLRMVSHAGTVGHEMRKVVEFSYPWNAGSLLLMHSDGLGSNWGFESYPGLALRHPSIVAGVLCRDFTRGRDDVSVVGLGEGLEAAA